MLCLILNVYKSEREEASLSRKSAVVAGQSR